MRATQLIRCLTIRKPLPRLDVTRTDFLKREKVRRFVMGLNLYTEGMLRFKTNSASFRVMINTMVNERGSEQPKEQVFQRYLDRLGLTIEEIRGKKILDVGAGSGGFAAMAEQYGAQVTSVDLIIGGPPENEVQTNHYVQADIERLPFADNTFDMCVSVAVVNETSTSGFEAAIQEAKRVLKPGGEFRLNGAPTFQLSDKDFQTLESLSVKNVRSGDEQSELMRLRFLLAYQNLLELIYAIESSLSFRQPLPTDYVIPSSLDDFPPLLENIPDAAIRYHESTMATLRRFQGVNFSTVYSKYLETTLHLLRNIEPSFNFFLIKKIPKKLDEMGFFYFTK